MTLRMTFTLVDSVTLINSIVNEVIRTISSLFIFFLRKHFNRTKTRHKQKPTNKTKLSEQSATKATIFRAHKNF